MRSTTIIDLAKVCDLDFSTVSRALRNDPRIKEATRERIVAAANKLGYQPNLAARMLRSKISHLLWFIAPDLGNPIDTDLVESSGLAAVERKYDLTVSLHFGRQEVFDRLVRAVSSGLAAGAIINRRDITDVSALRPLADRGFPLVVVDVPIESMHLPTVTTDQTVATQQLVDACVAGGARSAVLLFGGNNPVDLRRSEGAKAALARHGLPSLSGQDLVSGLGSLPEPVALIGNSQETVQNHAAIHAPEIHGNSLIFGCFDQWIGGIHPAKNAYVAIQDCNGIAGATIGRLADVLEGGTTGGAHLEIDLPLREVRKIGRLGKVSSPGNRKRK
jgi:hypothetical protein